MRDLSTSDFDWNDEATMSLDAASTIDRHSSFEGTFRTQRDLRVEGEVKGTVSCDGTLFIAEGASVAATVDAEHISVAGDLHGEIRCRGKFQILPSGRVHAKVSTAALVIQEGAVYEGQLEMAGIERPALRPLRARQSIASVGAESNPPERQPAAGTTFIRRLGSPEAPWESPTSDNQEVDQENDEPTGPAS